MIGPFLDLPTHALRKRPILPRLPSASIGPFVRPFVIVEILGGVDHPARFQTQNLQSVIGKDMAGNTTSGARSHNNHIVFIVGRHRTPELARAEFTGNAAVDRKQRKQSAEFGDRIPPPPIPFQFFSLSASQAALDIP